jgi:hypothetical protein
MPVNFATRRNAMTDNTNEPDQDNVLTTEVSDETLEASAAITDVAYTLGACTGLSVCPA